MKHPIAHLFKGIKEDYNWLSPELCGEVYNLCRDTLFENVDGIKFYMWLNMRAKSPLIPKSRAKTQIKYLVHRLSGMIDTDKDPVQHIDTSVSESFSELEDDLGDAILRGLGDAKRKELLIKTWEKRVVEMCGISYELIAFGIRFFFYLDEHRPIHVHISYGGKKAKIELEPQVKVVYNHGLKEQTLKKAVATCENYRDEFIAEWHRRFDD